MYKWIAMDHIKEHGKKYYPALIKMEKKLKWIKVLNSFLYYFS
jgi:hypothetical protein